MKSTIVSVILMLLPASLFAADQIIVETKIFESSSTKIPHDLAQIAKIKGTDIMSAPTIITKSGKKAKIEIVREYQPASVAPSLFKAATTGVSISVTPHLKDGKIAFSATITASELVGEKAQKKQTQAEIASRTLYISGIQKKGEEGWFDLVNPRQGKEGRKLTIWMRFNLHNAEAVDAPKIGK